VFVLTLLIAGTALAAELELTEKGKNAPVEMILSNLPAKGSNAYDELAALAGKEAMGLLLPLTQSEMWSVPKENADAVKTRAAARGVGVYEIGADWNKVFRPMPGTRGSWERKKTVRDRARSLRMTGSLRKSRFPSQRRRS
jgi:hypothetical protein